ncbi:hypothetical protein [Bradyrhizobium sp. AUGA SZCCT0042]|uniref:hypothetical protein n=1 Tax=Bradyrhizobium sp. AUGA SZCCT0042 TaxID=2807651 RepID=UPI001BA5AD56|nr:hypothetical protein [Bradyrhizobium sp. AUGA SZCCT0042]MBR1298555.1 hypothetical protein [Bradyrhizobium sp. AUGA SZCCT0042]
MSTSLVSVAEVAELKAAHEAQPPGDVDTTLETPAEVVAFLVHRLRSIGADEEELAHDVELVLRAAEMERESIRAARDTLAALGYGTAITKAMTALARKAKPIR